MTTIINTPAASPTEDSSAGIILGIIFGVLLVIAFIVFGVRYYWYGSSNSIPAQATVVVPSDGTTINVTAPLPTTNSN